MKDPYQVLNISPSASDDEIKRAYRLLARKYHPDNYHDNPLADLAQEKMKEINEAYEQIQKQRKNGAGIPRSESGGWNGRSREDGWSYGGADRISVLQRVRMAISSGDVSQAERLLNAVTDRSAEWHFLMGVVCSRRGWMDEAGRHFETACRMEPGNGEYKSALDAFAGTRYRPERYRNSGTMSYGGDDCLRICATYAACNLCCGGRFFCIPC
jgi:curved DNA-binding protein CbpA